LAANLGFTGDSVELRDSRGAAAEGSAVDLWLKYDYRGRLSRPPRIEFAGGAAITLCWDRAGLSHNENTALFCMPSSNSVAQKIRGERRLTTRKLCPKGSIKS